MTPLAIFFLCGLAGSIAGVLIYRACLNGCDAIDHALNELPEGDCFPVVETPFHDRSNG